MKQSFIKSRKIYYVTLCALLIFALTMVVTGSWFTDSGSIKGDLTKPIIQPKIVYKDGSNYNEFGSESFYWSSDADNKEIYVKFDTSNTVKNQICRITYSITWGTLENNVWTPKTSQPADSLTLKPNNFDTTKWINSVNGIGDTSEAISKYLLDNGITETDLAMLGLSSTDVINSILANTKGPITMYYYNNVINIENATYIKICDGFSFDSTVFSSSDFEGLTAKISVMAEANSVSDKVIGAGGEWIYNTDGTYRDDRPSDELVTNWKNSI